MGEKQDALDRERERERKWDVKKKKVRQRVEQDITYVGEQKAQTYQC